MLSQSLPTFTGSLSEVTELCQKVLILKSGEKLAFDTMEGLRQRILEGRQASLEELYLRLIEGKAPTSTDSESSAQAVARAAETTPDLRSLPEASGADAQDDAAKDAPADEAQEVQRDERQ